MGLRLPVSIAQPIEYPPKLAMMSVAVISLPCFLRNSALRFLSDFVIKCESSGGGLVCGVFSFWFKLCLNIVNDSVHLLDIKNIIGLVLQLAAGAKLFMQHEQHPAQSFAW